MNTPDGGGTDEPMPPDFARAYAEAYPDRVKEYVLSDKLRAAEAEVDRLTAQLAEAERGLKYEQHRAGRQGTHGLGCYTWGPAHYECALAQLAALGGEP